MKPRRIASLLLIILVLCSFSVTALAADSNESNIRASNLIFTKSGSVDVATNGTVTISFSVRTYSSCTSLGASVIKLYSSSGLLLKTYYPSSYPNMLSSGSKYSSSVTYSGNASSSYYAVITIYAANSLGSDSQDITVYS